MDDKNAALALAAIKRHYLFSSLSDGELSRLIATARSFDLRAEEVLFNQDQEADRFYLVVDGQVKLYRTSADGNEKVVEIITPGQTIAEAVMFMQRHCYPVSAQAIRPGRVYGICNDTFMALLKENRDACLRIMGDISMRLHARLNDVVNLTQQNATFRVIRFLMSQLPHEATDGVILTLNTPKQVIASRLSVKPETLSRIMSNLASHDIIQVKGREVHIRNIARLRDFE
jgi:CRP-like cAMP-binding protein